jgi:hypothetical protein
VTGAGTLRWLITHEDYYALFVMTNIRNLF